MSDSNGPPTDYKSTEISKELMGGVKFFNLRILFYFTTFKVGLSGFFWSIAFALIGISGAINRKGYFLAIFSGIDYEKNDSLEP